MSKVYILAICLLAASFTGCLGSDDNTETDTTIDDKTNQEETEQEETEQEETEQEEELIVPVGESVGNSTSDCVCNCSLVVEDTRYNPEHFSSVFITNQYEGSWVRNGSVEDNHWKWVDNSDGNDFSVYSNFRGWFNKTGNNVHITPTYDEFTSYIQTNHWHKIIIYGPDGLNWQDYVIMVRHKNANGTFYHLNEIDIELPWEPVGFSLQSTGESYLDSQGNSFNTPILTRAF